MEAGNISSVSVSFFRVGSQISPRRAKKDSNIPSPGRTRSVKCPITGPTKTIKSPPHALPPRTLRSDHGDGNANLKREMGLISKTTTLHVHHAFLYISLLSLHDYDVKMPNFTFYRGSAQATTKFPLSF